MPRSRVWVLVRVLVLVSASVSILLLLLLLLLLLKLCSSAQTPLPAFCHRQNPGNRSHPVPLKVSHVPAKHRARNPSSSSFILHRGVRSARSSPHHDIKMSSSTSFNASNVDLTTADPAQVICALNTSKNDYNGNLGVRVSALFVIMIVSSFATFFPVVAKREPRLRIPLYVYLFAR